MYNAIYFVSRNQNQRFASELKRRGYSVKVISSPMETGSSCNLAVLIKSSDLHAALQIAEDLAMRPDAVFEAVETNGRRRYRRV